MVFKSKEKLGEIIIWDYMKAGWILRPPSSFGWFRVLCPQPQQRIAAEPKVVHFYPLEWLKWESVCLFLILENSRGFDWKWHRISCAEKANFPNLEKINNPFLWNYDDILELFHEF